MTNRFIVSAASRGTTRKRANACPPNKQIVINAKAANAALTELDGTAPLMTPHAPRVFISQDASRHRQARPEISAVD
ncbi:MAG TPA: hypothetical protein VH142_16925 [Polyangiaceae bacterium]|jgi:hypothetical protein|nr:hypothetical protein [Polyangiaceae bacterium]